jgi:hypothetical protein
MTYIVAPKKEPKLMNRLEVQEWELECVLAYRTACKEPDKLPAFDMRITEIKTKIQDIKNEPAPPVYKTEIPVTLNPIIEIGKKTTILPSAEAVETIIEKAAAKRTKKATKAAMDKSNELKEQAKEELEALPEKVPNKVE